MLTNKEYVEAVIGAFGFEDKVLDIILCKARLNPLDDADAEACDLAIYKQFSLILLQTAQKVSEGGYSLSWDIQAVKLYYGTLSKALGHPNVLLEAEREQSRIVNRSNLW